MDELEKIPEWIQSQIKTLGGYGSIRVEIQIHDGRITLVERSISEKVKPNDAG